MCCNCPAPCCAAGCATRETLTARKVCGDRGAGHLMIGMINTLAADIDTLEAGSVAAIAESVENILVAGLCSLPGAADPVVSQLTAFHRDQIKAYALRHLRDPQLSVNAIAAHLRLSPSTIYRAFAGEPISLNSWIWNQRLDGAKRDICDPTLANRTITEIAFGWGFNDAAHFSRIFRAALRLLGAGIAGGMYAGRHDALRHACGRSGARISPFSAAA